MDDLDGASELPEYEPPALIDLGPVENLTAAGITAAGDSVSVEGASFF